MNAKRPTIIVTPNPLEGTITFDVDGHEVLVLNVAELSEEIVERGTYHGFEQKVRDAAAIGYKGKDGVVRRPTAKEKYDAMAEVIANLNAGEWNAKREGGESYLFEALCRLYDGKKDAAEIKAYLAKKESKERTKLAQLPKVAEMIAKIRAERNPDAVEVAEELLDEMLAS